MIIPVVRGGAVGCSKQLIYLENTFVCTEREAYLEVDNIRIVYDFDLECIIGWYNPNAE